MQATKAILFAVGILGFAVGCGGEPGPRKYEITGTVKFDGKEIATGDIMFVPENKSIGAEGGKIENGKYTMKAREGKNRVEIRATRTVPGKKGPMGEDWVEQFIPDQFNEKSKLSADVGSGKTTHDFDLTK